MGHLTYFSGLLTVFAHLAYAGLPPPQSWDEKSIYQIMTDRFARPPGSPDEPCDPFRYCGGSWSGIIDKLDYIQDLGFTAVQISPVMENIPDNTKYGEAYHGYWPQNLYSLNEHFGNADDLRKLSSELHKRGMYLMVDVVINNMAQANHGSNQNNPRIDWSRLYPFDDESYYHSFCNITDWNHPDVSKNCWFSVDGVALPDLKTEDRVVVSMMQEWVKGFVGNYSIDGLRVDAAKHVDDAYLSSFTEAAGVFTMGEVYTGDISMFCKYEESVSGLLNYPIHSPIIQAFTAGNMPGLAEQIRTLRSQCSDFTGLATFVENHDSPRFASLINDTTLAKNAMAFNILSDGIPVVYQGQEQHMDGRYSPYNRQPLWTTGYTSQSSLYNVTATLNNLRNHAIRLDKNYTSNHSQELYLDGSTYVTRKGSEGSQIVSMFSNQGSQGGPYRLTVKGAFAPATEVMEVLSCTMTTAYEEGKITIEMDEGEPKIFYPVRKLSGSGLCGFHKPKYTCSNGNSTVKNNSSDGNTYQLSSSGSFASLSFTTALLCGLTVAAGWFF